MKKLFILLVVMFINIQISGQCFKIVKTDASNQTFAIKTDGTLWAWGHNNFGQLGDGTFGDGTNKSSPTQIGTDTDWESIAVGLYHTIALKTDGTLWTWGLNLFGELGDGTYDYGTEKYVPTKIGTASDWKYIAAGAYHTLAIKTDGTLWGWGSNFYGELGDGTSGLGTNKYIPTKIGTDTWISINAGTFHSIGIKTGGTLWVWGKNDKGQLGDGTKIDKNIPKQIGTGTNWKTAYAGGYHNIALNKDGTLWAWGSNEFGQLGTGIYDYYGLTPTQIGTTTNWKIIAAGGNHTIAIKNDGTLWAWGYNQDGEYGNGSYYNNSFIPVQIGISTDWNSVATGFAHTIFIKTDGTLWATGSNWLGQLGDGTFDGKNNPIQIGCALLGNTQAIVQNATFNLYPNPTKELLYLQNTSNQPIDKIVITDFLGKTIVEQIDNKSYVNTQQLQQGLYLLNIISDKQIYSYKFLKN